MMPCHRKPVPKNAQGSTTGTDDNTCGCQVSDPPRYTNVRMPFSTLYPQVPLENPTGVYRLEFTMNRCSWVAKSKDSSGSCKGNSRCNQKVILHLGAVESCFFVYLNGRFVGMGKDSRLPSEFDVTSFLHCNCSDCTSDETESANGNNILSIIALKWSDGSFLEQQDHWRGMGGIHRSVYLYSLPAEAYIEDVFCRATVRKIDEINGTENPSTFPQQWKGSIQVDARIGRSNTRVEGRDIYYNENIKFIQSDGVEYRMKFQIYDCSGQPLFQTPLDVTNEENKKLFTEVHLRYTLISFVASVPQSVLAWSDESPTLYQLEATLSQVTNESGRKVSHPIDIFRTKIGFRSVEIANRQLLVNGQPVLIKGVNRHDHSPTGGKAVTREEIRRDLTLMKEFNFNAIRTAHYPNDPYLYDLADELGLYVIDEANIECHGHYDMICREHTFTAAMLDRVQRMVVRDQNHPCIIGWSLGNEAGYAMNHTMLYGWIKGYDDSRFVQYEGANRPKWGQLNHIYDRKDSMLGTDVLCPMYASIAEMIQWADEIAPCLNEHRPMILCEYAHAMGNSSGSLSDYCDAINTKHGLQGGFIWDFIDQGIMERDLNGRFWFSYGGCYGDKPHDANFNINGMIGPDRQPHPAMFEFAAVAKPVQFRLEFQGNEHIIRLCNRRYFTTLDDLEAIWTLKIGGFVCDQGSFSLSGVPPQTNSELSIDALSTALVANKVFDLEEDVEVHIDLNAVTVDDGRCIALEQFTVRGDKSTHLDHIRQLRKHIGISESSQSQVELNQSEGGFSIRASDLELQVTKDMAELKYVSMSHGILFGLHLNLFRAGTDNDAVKQFGSQFHDPSKPLGRWLSLGLDSLDLRDAETRASMRFVPVVENDDKKYPTVITRATVLGRPGHISYKGIALAECVASSSEPVLLGHVEQAVTMLCDGSLFVDVKVELDESLKDLPRVGLELTIPERFDHASFFANGPHENYPDRKYSAHAGVYEEKVAEYLDSYVVPQEQGNRTDLRWL
jgi:beta-galactosidase